MYTLSLPNPNVLLLEISVGICMYALLLGISGKDLWLYKSHLYCQSVSVPFAPHP